MNAVNGGSGAGAGAIGLLNEPSPGSDAGIEFRGVGKRYADSADAPWAVRDVSFTVPRGTLTTILGPSGCGKTTTLRLIAGLESPSAGRIFIDGRDVTALAANERNVSMVFQSYALFPHMSVLANVCYGLDVSGVAKGEARRRAEATLAGVGLAGFETRLPSELSGGQQQRVALARALVIEPAVLLFDEPLSNLDARLRRTMRDEIRSLQQRLRLTVAYVTHDQGEALAVSDQIIVMDAGRIAQAGIPQQLYESPSSEFVAGFMGEATLFDATRNSDGQVRLGPLLLGALFDDMHGTATGAAKGATPVRVAVRPHAWRVHAMPLDGALPATLTRCAYLGSHVELDFETQVGSIFAIASSADPPKLPGEQCWLTVAERGWCAVRP